MQRGVKLVILALLLTCTFLLPVRMGDGANASLPVIGAMEEISATQCRETLKKATAAYISAKVINSIITSLERIEVSVQPMGIGLSFAPGELLSAANDAIERVCTALFSVIGLMLLEKLILGMLSFVCFKVLFPSALILYFLYYLFPKFCAWTKPTAFFLVKLAIISLFIFPAIAVVTQYVEISYLDAKLKEQLETVEFLSNKMEETKFELENIDENDQNEDLSWWEKPKKFFSSIKDKLSPSHVTNVIKQKTTEIVNYADEASDQLFHSFCIFMLTTVVIPLFLIFIFYNILKLMTQKYLDTSTVPKEKIVQILEEQLKPNNGQESCPPSR